MKNIFIWTTVAGFILLMCSYSIDADIDLIDKYLSKKREGQKTTAAESLAYWVRVIVGLRVKLIVIGVLGFLVTYIIG